MKDQWGNPVSHGSETAIRGLERAMEMFAGFQADPLAAIDGVLEQHPDFVLGHAFRASMLATAADRAFDSEIARSVAAAEALASGANERERGYIAAGRAWLDGDFEAATETWGRLSIAYPNDLSALQLAHLADFLHGYSHMLRDRVARVLPQWSPDMPGYGYLLGMYAFGLEESGDYRRAEEYGRKAAALNPKDGWGVHAVAHVMEMEGRADEGIAFMRAGASGWTDNNMFAYHNWWHTALFALEAGDVAGALALYDDGVSCGGFGQAMELVDGSALLWRLTTLGHDVGGRWQPIADKWATRREDGYYAFNDLHAMQAFVGAGRKADQLALLAAVERSAGGSGTNAMMAREVGVAAVSGIEAFGRGAYAEAIDRLMPLRAKANRFGGSHAQRDVFSWTLTEAALRAGDRPLANALVAERLSWKPESPLNRAWARRAGMLERRTAASTAA